MSSGCPTRPIAWVRASPLRKFLERFIARTRSPRGKRRRHDSRADTVHSNIVFPEFQGNGSREMDDGGLGDTVEVGRLAGLEPGDRGRADDRSTAAGTHCGRRMFDAEKDALQQHVEGDIEFLDRCGFDRSEGPAETSVVVDAIESTPALHHFIDRGLDLLFAGDVDALKEGGIAEFLASASPRSVCASAIRTRAPSSTKSRTLAAPIPLAPPVMMAVLPSSRFMISLRHALTGIAAAFRSKKR